MWAELLGRLAFYELYKHEGVGKFNKDELEVIGYEEQLEHGRIASRIIERIFAGGLDFLRGSYPQQAAHIAARLDWVEDKQPDELDEGPARRSNEHRLARGWGPHPRARVVLPFRAVEHRAARINWTP